MKNILTTLIKLNNFGILNVIGPVGMGKHYNISEASKEVGYKQVTVVTQSIDVNMDLSKYNDYDKLVLVFDDMDRASDTVVNHITKGIINRNLFNLNLKNVVVVATSIDVLDIDSAILNRSVIIENK